MRRMKIAAACAHTGESRKALYRAVRSGELRAIRVGAGRNLIFVDAWLDEWQARRATSVTSPANVLDTQQLIRGSQFSGMYNRLLDADVELADAIRDARAALDRVDAARVQRADALAALQSAVDADTALDRAV